MKFSEFLHLRQRFMEKINTSDLIYNIEQLRVTIGNPIFKELNLPEFVSDNLLKESIESLNKELQTFSESLDNMYNNFQQEALLKSQKHYDTNLKHVEPYYIRKHQIKPTDELIQYISNKIDIRSNWQFPVLELQPSDTTWTSKLVAGTPLYVLSTSHHDLLNIKKQFNDIYQKRLCLYYNTCKDLEKRKVCILISNSDFDMFNTPEEVIKGYEPEPAVELPRKQFGYVFSYNCFNYMSVEVINRYIKLISELLRPGGIALVGYSNCDQIEACNFYEKDYWTYNNEKLMIEMIQDHGLEVLKSDNNYSYYSFIEFKAPAQLRTIKTQPPVVKNISLS